MTRPFRFYMGWDPVDVLAYEVCAHSLKQRASIPVEVIPLHERQLRNRQPRIYWRPFHCDEAGQRFDGVDGLPCSTEFSFTRFLVPVLEDFGSDWVGFGDPDMLWRADIAELLDHLHPSMALMCVHHDHQPVESTKMTGMIQTRYRRKNWSSLFLIKPSANRWLTPYRVNRSTGSQLHQFIWLDDDAIGSLPESWNWLAGWSSPEIDPKIVHFTRGTPDMAGYESEPFAEEWRSVLQASGVRLAAFPTQPN